MILTKEVEIRVNGNNIKYYENLGYIIPMKEAAQKTKQVMHKNLVYDFSKTIMVKVEDLPKSSFARVDVLCDYCNEEIFSTTYHHYNEEMKHINKHACRKCWQRKKEEVFMMKYGVRTPFQLECVQKQKTQSYIDHYGVDNPNKSPEFRKATKRTCLERYGYENPSQSPEIKSKIARTFYQNGTTPTSRQQLYIFNIYKSTDAIIELNYPISHFNADICLPNEKIDIEYDGGFHNGMVQMGKLTQEEFDRKELIRDKVIKSEGYNIIRIKSDSDKLPTDPILLQLLSEAKQYFSETSHSWMTFDIDNSRMINAENKDTNGIPYSFGSLRTIKDKDIQITNQNLKGA